MSEYFEATPRSNGTKDTLFFNKHQALVNTVRKGLPGVEVYTMNCPAIHCPDTKLEVSSRSIKAGTTGGPEDDPEEYIDLLLNELVDHFKKEGFDRVYLYTLGVMVTFPGDFGEDGSIVVDYENGTMSFTIRYGYLND